MKNHKWYKHYDVEINETHRKDVKALAGISGVIITILFVVFYIALKTFY